MYSAALLLYLLGVVSLGAPMSARLEDQKACDLCYMKLMSLQNTMALVPESDPPMDVPTRGLGKRDHAIRCLINPVSCFGQKPGNIYRNRRYSTTE